MIDVPVIQLDTLSALLGFVVGVLFVFAAAAILGWGNR
jgi:hypothetical protein